MKIALAILASLVVAYAVLLIALIVARPKGNLVQEALRLLPDVLRLVRRLAADRAVPRGARVRLWLLLCYLAVPFDLVPDFIPVLGYADDAVIVSLVLRSVIRKSGVQKVRDHWPGTDDGLRALGKVTGLGPLRPHEAADHCHRRPRPARPPDVRRAIGADGDRQHGRARPHDRADV